MMVSATNDLFVDAANSVAMYGGTGNDTFSFTAGTSRKEV
jgi:hypothetical protein